MEETDAQSVATTVTGELDHPPPSSVRHWQPLFSQAGLLNTLKPPGKPSVPPSHEHSDWISLRLRVIRGDGNRSGTMSPDANGPLCAHYSGSFWISVVDWH